MLMNRSQLTSSAPARFWGWLEILLTCVPLFLAGVAALFLWEGAQKWFLVNQLLERGDVAMGRVVETAYRSERSSTGVYNQRLICLVEYRTAEGNLVRQWELDGVNCQATYQLRPPQGDTPGALVPNYGQSFVHYLPEAPTRASADLELTRDRAKLDFGFGIAGILGCMLVGYFCLTLLRIRWAEFRYVPILKRLGQQQDYTGIIRLLETYRQHPAANILVWEAAEHLGRSPEHYPRLVDLFEQMQTSPSKKKLESVDESIVMISFYRLSSLGFHDLALAMLARSKQALSAKTLASFVLMTCTKQLPFALELTAEKLAALKALCEAKVLRFGLADEKQCPVDFAVQLDYLLCLVTLVLDNTALNRQAGLVIGPVQRLILTALTQAKAFDTLSQNSAQALDKQIQVLLTRIDSRLGFEYQLKPLLESILAKLAQPNQQPTLSVTKVSATKVSANTGK
ncbi:hypothetical protein CF168_03420 [Shewanella bicestrii]|uniref:Uncharacterized protein n=2 Tax=Shewanella bicestrii TaxID=2018305 RepID=A0A220UJ15_9GAMM|nr:hypothetical protein CF168_03420 [Shewanella bicestrii]